MEVKPTVTVFHRLPGRVRLRLSHAIIDVPRLYSSIETHEGLEKIEYTSVTKSILLCFDDAQVSLEEILVRIALCLSLDYGNVNVRVLATPEHHELADSTLYSAMLLVTALASRLVGQSNTTKTLSFIAGVGTASAVLSHALQEVDERGNFDPEVLSVVYLVTSMLRGNVLPAAVFTWATTFGRHLFALPARGVEIKPIELDKEGGVEVVVSPDSTPPARAEMLGLLPSLFKYVISGGGESHLLDQLQEASRVHGEVLEGLGTFRNGIPIKFR